MESEKNNEEQKELKTKFSIIAVVGGSRGVGFNFVRLALEKGHQVRALLRNSDNYSLASSPNLKIFKGDVLHPETLEDFIAGADCVVSTLGVNHMMGYTEVISKGMQNIIATMEKHKVSRLINLSSAYLSKTDPQVGFFLQTFVWFVGGVFDDHIRNEKNLFSTPEHIQYSNVRAAQLTDKPGTGKYRLEVPHLPKKAPRITRQDTALALYDILMSDKYSRQTVHIGN